MFSEKLKAWWNALLHLRRTPKADKGARTRSQGRPPIQPLAFCTLRHFIGLETILFHARLASRKVYRLPIDVNNIWIGFRIPAIVLTEQPSSSSTSLCPSICPSICLNPSADVCASIYIRTGRPNSRAAGSTSLDISPSGQYPDPQRQSPTRFTPTATISRQLYPQRESRSHSRSPATTTVSRQLYQQSVARYHP